MILLLIYMINMEIPDRGTILLGTTSYTYSYFLFDLFNNNNFWLNTFLEFIQGTYFHRVLQGRYSL